ncbi:MAG TPA: bifunctional riboflavin kinase/FAD synthetase [Candidatus Limnocylindrales bacterium]
MIVLRGIDELPRGLRFALAIGTFDGVHRGHRRVIDALTRGARDLGAKSVVLTFDPHPAAVLRGSAPPALCDLEERLAWLGRSTIDVCVVQHFDATFADQSPRAFLEHVSTGRDLAGLVMTQESAFGRQREGGLDAVRQLGPVLGFRVLEVARLETHGSALSSTRVRGLLEEGRLADVARLLGRPYSVIGSVVRGDGRGHELGFPTANLRFDDPVALPPDGIYAVRVGWGGPDVLSPTERRDGVASLGVRPTFEVRGARVLEVHVLDFEGDLYGQRMRVEFVRRLRGEKGFASGAALVTQMERDADRARKVLAARPR